MPFPSSLPTPRTPDQMAEPPLNRAIAGPGWIAVRFVQALRDGTRWRVMAVSSRASDGGRGLGGEMGHPPRLR